MIIFHLRYKQNIQRLTLNSKSGYFKLNNYFSEGTALPIDFLFDEITSTLAGIHLSILIFHTSTLLYLKYEKICNT